MKTRKKNILATKFKLKFTENFSKQQRHQSSNYYNRDKCIYKDKVIISPHQFYYLV